MNNSRNYSDPKIGLHSAIWFLLGLAFILGGCSESKIAPTEPQEELGEIQLQKLAGTGQAIPDHYIVVFKDDVADPAAVANGLAQAHALGLRHTYTAALKGFAAVIPPARLDAVRNDPRIRYIVPDQVDKLYQQTLPTGIDRIEADLNTSPTATNPVDVDIAIIDTGIDLDHPDLNVVSNISFAGGNGNDKNGHGTHVAGTAAALDNNIAVVGVAPGARLHAVQVCKPGGICFRSDIIAGIDYVTANADVIEVVNMSLGGSGSDDGNCGLDNNDPEHEAICSAVAAGVVFVVAAGNESDDAANHVPAAYDEVITVSALADFDGKAGGAGAPTCRTDEDDSFANFSNFGADVDLMAPGVCIESTWNDGGTNTISGTSMSSPHVTGTVALYIAKNGRATNKTEVLAIRDALVAAGVPQMDDCGLSTFDDPDNFAEPIVFANAIDVGGNGSCEVAGPPAPPPTLLSISVTPTSASIEKGQTQQFTAIGSFDDASSADLTSTATWVSSNIAVATINASGLATGVSEGMTNITASQDGVTSNTATLEVTAPSATDIVTITKAQYRSKARRLQVEAQSTDATAVLTAFDADTNAPLGELVDGKLNIKISPSPANVRVDSDKGGSDTKPVEMK